MTTSPPLSWIKQMSHELSLSKQIPLWGEPPPFPWDALAKELQPLFKNSTLRLLPGKVEQVESSHFLTSFGENPSISCLELSPLPGTLHFVISAKSLEKITTLLLSKDSPTPIISDSNLLDGFYQYFLLRVADSLDQLATYPSLQMQWVEKKPLPKTASFISDVEIWLDNEMFQARLIIPPEFHDAFSSHFKPKTFDWQNASLTSEMNVAVRFELGSCTLSQKEWSSAKIGDFVILDRCSYDPSIQKGILTLILGTTPLFKVKIKKNKFKILDYYTYNGDQSIMEEDMDLEPFDEELPLPESSSEELELEEPLEDEEIEKAPEEPLSLPEDINLPLVVEISKTQMNLQKLLEMQPGNILDLSVRPEDGVYLTVHGKKIAKGELIKIGETLGVKITAVGESKL